MTPGVQAQFNSFKEYDGSSDFEVLFLISKYFVYIALHDMNNVAEIIPWTTNFYVSIYISSENKITFIMRLTKVNFFFFLRCGVATQFRLAFNFVAEAGLELATIILPPPP